MEKKKKKSCRWGAAFKRPVWGGRVFSVLVDSKAEEEEGGKLGSFRHSEGSNVLPILSPYVLQ